MLLFKIALMKLLTNRLKIVLDHKGDKYQPAISIVDENGEEFAQYYLPTGSYLVVEEINK